MPEPIALIDLDGTIADFDGAMTRELARLAAPEEKTYLDRTPHVEARRQLIKRQPGFWRNLQPIQDGFDVVDLLKECGYTLMVLTKGPSSTSSAWTEKVEWCQHHLPEAQITISQDKSLVYGRILFDDWPRYSQPWLVNRPRGRVIMLDHSWNRKFSHPRMIRYHRRSTLTDEEWEIQRESLRQTLIKTAKIET